MPWIVFKVVDNGICRKKSWTCLLQVQSFKGSFKLKNKVIHVICKPILNLLGRARNYFQCSLVGANMSINNGSTAFTELHHQLHFYFFRISSLSLLKASK